MIPRLFSADYTHGNTTFTGHGLGDLIEATKIEAEENSSEGHEWELSFEYPETGDLFNELQLNRIVLAKVNDYQPFQAFRIYSISKNIKHTVTVSCQHISYDLQNVPVKPFSKIGASDCLVELKRNMVDDSSVVGQATYGKQFTFTTDIPDPEHKENPESEAERTEITLEFEEPQNARSLLFDSENSVVGKYGGDVIIDNYSIDFKAVGGEDRGISIDYGVDLIDFDQEKNISSMITGILPYYVKDKDVRVDIRTEKDDTVYDPEYNSKSVIKFSMDDPITLEPNFKYTLTFTPENTINPDDPLDRGNAAVINWNLGIGSYSFNLDGINKKYEFILDNSVTISKDITLFYEFPNQDNYYGTISNISLVKNPIEPIVYGDIVTRNDSGYEYEIPKYDVPKIQPVNVTDYFADPNVIPTASEVTAKGQEYVNKEEVGIPEVSLTVSYADLDGKEVHLYDAVQVRFVKMGVNVKSKVTRYKYDVLNERVLEIDVGKTKDSAIFTLQDAGRLKHGLLKPDRLAKESIGSDKLAKNSVGVKQLDTQSFSGGGWKMPADAFDKETLRDKVGTEALIIGSPHGPHRDAVLRQKPLTTADGYHRDIGYVFDPSLGVPPDNLPGWRDQYDEFHSMAEYKATSHSYQGHGYVLNPDFIFENSIDAEKKIVRKSVKTDIIADDAVTNVKIKNGSVDWAKTAQEVRDWYDEINEKTQYFGKVIGPTFDIIADENTGYVTSVSTGRINIKDGAGNGYINFVGHGILSPHTLYLNNSPVGTILSSSDIYITDSQPDLYTHQQTVVTDVSVDFDAKALHVDTDTIRYESDTP